ncbi:alpha/beta hydrolase [bacterium]|nr:alpha/beta hydrolase [bacterium]
MPFVHVGDHKLDYEWHGPGSEAARTLVFLHEGLGSVSGWRDFPARLAAATGRGALVYSRRGYGRSDPLVRPFTPSFMHDEARGDLPAILSALGVRQAILVGHSDGGSIGLIRAGDGAPEVKALVLEAPHVFVEDVTVASIAKLRERSKTDEGLIERFRRHHGENTLPLLQAWTGVWLDPAFRSWNIVPALANIACPVLVVQGENDEYGTLAQVQAVQKGVGGPVETLVLPRCGHAPHRDQPEATLEAMTRFVCGLDGLIARGP